MKEIYNMKHKIEEKNNSINIEISDIDNKDILIQNLRECQEGTCSCPTNEYEKLVKMEIQVSDDDNKINVHLEPKKGKSIKFEEIDKCLDHASKHSSKE